MRGKQRYKCKKCNYNFTEGDKRVSFSKPGSVKNKAIQLYLLDLGFRAIGRFLGVSVESETEISVMELDEMWHYCQKKSLKSGSGWRFVVIAKKR